MSAVNSDVTSMNVDELQAALADGATSVDITRAYLDRIEAADGELRAYLHVDPEAALARAAEIDAAGDKSGLAGVPVEGVLGWVPGSGSHTVGVCIFTYAGTVRVGVITDAALVPDPERIVAAFEAELDLFVSLAAPADSPAPTHSTAPTVSPTKGGVAADSARPQP